VLDADWQVGSPVTIRHDYDDQVDSVGAVPAADRPRGLSYEFAGGQVTFELLQQRRGHPDGHPHRPAEHFARVSGGWSFILSNLKTLLESGATLPMPEQVLDAFR
jgi:hypothetical protein